MTNILRKIALCAVCLIVAAKAATGKEWRGIVPLKSTRTEIERVFGAPKYTSYSGAYYSLAKEIVVFDYQTTPCKEDQLGLGWNVPIGTVVGIGVIPGMGGAVSQFIAYAHAQQTSKNPETFGRGASDRVIVE